MALPRTDGTRPDTGKTILAGTLWPKIGRYGPWLEQGACHLPLSEDGDVLTAGLNRVATLADTRTGRQGGGLG